MKDQVIGAQSAGEPAAGLVPLAGVRIVDFSQALSGPYCSLMLADLGADVIKVESPQRGDDARHWGPPYVGSDAAYFASVNRNKRSVTLDLKDREDFDKALQLIASSDVVLENWRPGTAQRLGLGSEAMRARHPSLIYCSISGFGQDQGARAGYDQIVQGTSGSMTLTGRLGEPTKWGVPVGDIATGMFAATAILGALYERRLRGVGRTIDVAMQDSLLSMLTHHAARYLADGDVPVTSHNGHPTIVPYGMFATVDGFINVCVGNDSQYDRMCKAIDRNDLAASPHFATNPLRVAHQQQLMNEVAATLAAMTTAAALAALEQAGVPAGAVVDVRGVLEDPATTARNMILSFDRDDVSGARVMNTPWKFDGATPAMRLPPPHLGEHNQEVLDHLEPADQRT